MPAGRCLPEAGCGSVQRRRRGCSSGLRLALALKFTSPGSCRGEQLDVRVAKGFYSRGYDFLRVSVLGEKGEAPFVWAPNFRMLKRGECEDIGYLPITDAALCKAALKELLPKQRLEHSEVRRTTDPESPYGCFLLDSRGGEERAGQLWIGSSLGFGTPRDGRQQRDQDSNQHPLCRSQAYQADFFHRWTSKTLESEVLQVDSAGSKIAVGGSELHLKLPRQGQGVTGVLLSDPCFGGGGGVPCPNGRHMHTLKRMTETLNVLLGSDEFHFWAILGNNFYDQNGAVSSEFFSHLHTSAKLKPLFTVPGNHDFWIGGEPPGLRNDSLGYGFMQFYGQDTAAATPALPYHFAGAPEALQIAKAENFILASQLGDLALFGYSGAHSWRMTEPHVTAFCRFVGETASINTILLLGHWATEASGCSPGMDVPSVHARMKRIDGCSAKRVLYFAGHTHCNRVDRQGEGFLVGGAGMRSPGCSQLGFTVLQSAPGAYPDPDVRVDYFPIHEESGEDTAADSIVIQDFYYDLIRCLRAHGYAGCREHHAHNFLGVRQAPGPSTSATSTTATTTHTSRSASTSSSTMRNSSGAGAIGAVYDPLGRHNPGMRAEPDWMLPAYRTPEPVGSFAPPTSPKPPAPAAASAAWGRLLGVLAAVLVFVGLTALAWLCLSWNKNRMRKGTECCTSPRSLHTSHSGPGGGCRGRPVMEYCEPETINVQDGSRLGMFRLAGGQQEHRYTPLVSADAGRSRVTPTMEDRAPRRAPTPGMEEPRPAPPLRREASPGAQELRPPQPSRREASPSREARSPSPTAPPSDSGARPSPHTPARPAGGGSPPSGPGAGNGRAAPRQDSPHRCPNARPRPPDF